MTTQDYTTSRHLTIDWAMFHRDIQLLAANLADAGPFKGIIAIARGGLVPAGILSRILDLRLVDTLCVSSYDERVQRPGEPELLKGVEGDGEGWLVVDDLVDSGATLRLVRDMMPKAHFATVYAKPKGKNLVDTTAINVDQHLWLVFPWDQDI
jgi:xanthine phosphoribosyltransferase